MVSFVLIEASTEIFDQPSWYPVLFTETVVIAWNPLKLGQQLDHRSALLAKIPGFKSEDWIELTHSKKAFWPIAKSKYNLNDSSDDYVELYRLVMHSLEPLNGRTRRVQRLHVFYRNLSISMVLVCVMLLYSFGSLISEEFPFSTDVFLFTILFLLFVIFIFFIIIVFLWRRSRRAEQDFINELICEFYQQEDRENDVQKNRMLSEYE